MALSPLGLVALVIAIVVLVLVLLVSPVLVFFFFGMQLVAHARQIEAPKCVAVEARWLHLSLFYVFHVCASPVALCLIILI